MYFISFLACAKCAKLLHSLFFVRSIKTTSQTKIFLYIGEFDRGAILNKKLVSPWSDKRAIECDTRKVTAVLPENSESERQARKVTSVLPEYSESERQARKVTAVLPELVQTTRKIAILQITYLVFLIIQVQYLLNQ